MHKEFKTHTHIGQPRKPPRPKALTGKMHKPKAVDPPTARSPVFTSRGWGRFRVKDDSGGAVALEAKEGPSRLRKGEQCVSVPSRVHRLIVARYMLTGVVRHFVSGASPGGRIRTRRSAGRGWRRPR